MGNSISLEENENGDQSSDIKMKSSVSQNESGENSSNNDTVKKSKRASSYAVKKRRTTSKNGNASALRKTKSVRRR